MSDKITVKHTKLWTTEILTECYFVVRKKPIRLEKLNQTRQRWLVCGFEAFSCILNLKGYFQEDNFWLQQPEFILFLLSYLNLSIQVKFKKQ